MPRCKKEVSLTTQESITDIFPCKYCGNTEPSLTTRNKCIKGIPWYCASVNCDEFSEERYDKIKKPVKRKRLNLNKVLVDTF